MLEQETTLFSEVPSGLVPSFTPRESRVRITHRPMTCGKRGRTGCHSGIRAPHAGYGPAYSVNPVTGCWVWLRSTDKDGYPYFRSDGKVIRSHRFYYERDKGAILDGLELDHLCQNRLCVNPDHLEAVPHVENVRRGRRCNHLTIEKAREIRALRGTMTHRAIAERYGISHALVAHVMTNRVWKEESASPSAGRSE